MAHVALVVIWVLAPGFAHVATQVPSEPTFDVVSIKRVNELRQSGGMHAITARAGESLRSINERRPGRLGRRDARGLAMGLLCLGLRAIDDRLIVAAIIAFALNFPCFALQRFNRARIYRVLQRAPANRHLFLEG